MKNANSKIVNFSLSDSSIVNHRRASAGLNFNISLIIFKSSYFMKWPVTKIAKCVWEEKVWLTLRFSEVAAK